MIHLDVKAAVMLLITLLLGVALGALGVSALSRHRADEVQQLRRPPGFVAHMEEVIAPRDSVQRAKIKPILAATAARNEAILQQVNEQLHTALDSMRAQIDPLLDAAQRDRLERASKLAPPIRAGGQGRDGRGPPPDGRGPLPDRSGPPPRGGPPPRP